MASADDHRYVGLGRRGETIVEVLLDSHVVAAVLEGPLSTRIPRCAQPDDDDMAGQGKSGLAADRPTGPADENSSRSAMNATTIAVVSPANISGWEQPQPVGWRRN